MTTDDDSAVLDRLRARYEEGGWRGIYRGGADFVRYDLWKPIRNFLTGVGDRYGLIGPEEIYADEYYVKREKEPWRSESRHIARVLHEYFEPRSVVDLGCAIGMHLQVFHEEGVEAIGVEGNPTAIKHAVIPSEHIIHHDLREPLELPQTFDLALSIEVAEHIPERHADVYVDSICRLATRVVLTAAPPGQGGTHHVNEQPKDYWIDMFEDRQFVFDPEATETLSEQFDVEHSVWVEENLLVFRNERANDPPGRDR